MLIDCVLPKLLLCSQVAKASSTSKGGLSTPLSIARVEDGQQDGNTDDDAADELVGKEVQIFWQDPHGWFDAKIISWSWALDENGARVRMHEVRVGRGRGWGGVLHASSHSGVRVLAVHRLSTRMASTTWTCCPKTLAIGGARWARSQLTTVTAVLQKTKLKTVRTSGSASAAGSASGASSIAG